MGRRNRKLKVGARVRAGVDEAAAESEPLDEIGPGSYVGNVIALEDRADWPWVVRLELGPIRTLDACFRADELEVL